MLHSLQHCMTNRMRCICGRIVDMMSRCFCHWVVICEGIVQYLRTPRIGPLLGERLNGSQSFR